MKNSPLLLGIAASAILLLGAPAAKAVHLELGLVTSMSTFTFDLSGYDSTAQGEAGQFIVNPETATFGTPQTFSGADLTNGADITISSGETMNANGSFTDTFTVSTPANFITGTTYNGIEVLQFDLGNANSGSGAVQITGPILNYTQTGSYTDTGGTFPLSVFGTTVTSGALSSSYSTSEGVYASSSLSAYGVDSFTYSITYNSLVPEPSSWAMLGLGAVLGGGAILRRRYAF